MPKFTFKILASISLAFVILFSIVSPSFAYLEATFFNNQAPKFQRDKYTTDLFTGTANYSYPFKVPKGTNDLTPEVSFNYNSSGTRDLKTYAGVGWVLNQDYIERDVNFTPSNLSDDKFRLHFKGAVYDLVYVASDSSYHTKIESFFKIKSLTGGSNEQSQYWQLITPDGTKYRFGYQTQSELLCAGKDYILSWNLDLVTDTNDNKIYYTYSDTSGIAYVTKIEYNNDQSRKIEFTYATNDFEHPGYTQGCYSYDKKKLTNIQMKIGTNLVREYDIAYVSADNMQPLLSSITEKGSDRSTYLATTFDYKSVNKGWQVPHETWLNDQPLATQLNLPNVTMVDANGDGFMDVVKTDIGSGVTWRVLINNGTNLPTSFQNWITNASIDTHLNQSFTRLMDVTGDGLPDIVRAASADAWIVYRNIGTAWSTTPEYWANLSSIHSSVHLSSSNVKLADMNGDGLPDIVRSWWNGGNLRWEVFRNTGSSWNTTADIWSEGGIPEGLDSSKVRLVDVNGDGTADVVRTVYSGSVATWYVWYSSGWHFSGQNIWLDADVNANFDRGDTTLGDANGDGLADIIKIDDVAMGSKRLKVLYNRGQNWTSQYDNWIEAEENADIDIADTNTRVTDVNGDGLIDLVRGKDICQCNTNDFYVWKNEGVSPYLLSAIHTDRGAVISFDYKPSTMYDNTGSDSQSDIPFSTWVVQKMTITNGLSNTQGTSDVTTYSYKDGFYKWQDKEMRGFAEVTENLPNGAKSITKFHQDDGKKGKMYEKLTSNSSDDPYTKIELTWGSSSTDGYYVTSLTSQKESIYDGNGSSPKVKQTDFTYDSYGNVLKQSELGDTSVSGDERFMYNEYTYNTTDWIVNTAKKTYLNAANDSTKVNETSFYYDEHTGLGDAPSKGDLTKEVKWTDGLFTTDPTTTYAYDTFGNQTSVTDANNHATTTAYESTGTYPTSTTNAKNQTTYIGYDLGTGNLLYQNDPNDFSVDYEYDVYGRITKEIREGDTSQYPTVSYTYYTFGVDGTKVSKKENTGSSSATLDTYTWIDGLGRTISTRTDAENSAKQIVTTTYYDPTGQVKNVTVPYEDDHYDYYRDPITGIRSTDTTYDVLGRPTVITNPKGDNKTIAYDHWKETTIDENGNIKREFKNAFDKIIKVEEVNDAATYTTTYMYDSRDLLIKITDHENNDITFIYDALGRKTSMTDPDMGTWDYEYDAIGNLIKQTDNRDVQVTKTYDELNRITGTNYPNDTDVSYTYDGNSKIGTLTSVTDAAGTVNYTYDNRLRKTAEARTVGGVTKTTQFAYDPMDRVTSQTNPDNEVITNTFNNQGEIESVSNVVSNINYNALGKITQKSFSNGLTTNYTYNTNDFRLNRIQTSTLQDLNYTYDNVGNVSSITDAVESKTQQFTYDDLDRLKTATESAGFNYAYNYSSIGNLTKFTDAGVETDYGYGANGKVHAMTSSSEKVSPPKVNASGTPYTSSVTDNWSSGTIDTSKWTNWGGSNVTVSNEELAMTSSLGGGYYGVDSGVDSRLYDMTGSSIVNKVVNAGNQSIGSWEVYPIYAYINGDSSNQFFFFIGEGKLRAYKKVNGVSNWLAQTDYNATNHKWFRIRESGGTTYFDTSANGTSWTNFASVANPFSVTGMVIGSEVGTWATESSTTSAVFDNFNYATAPTATQSDDWATGSIDSGKWANWGGSNVAVSSQELTITSNAGGGYYGVDSGSNVFNLTNSYIVNKLVDAGNQSIGSWEVYPIYAYVDGDSSTQYFFYISENTLRAYKKVGGSNTVLASTTYNSANHKWFRIRESGGTTYFDTSADGGIWNNFASTANTFDLTQLVVGSEVGTWSSEASTTTATFDNFNVWHPVYVYDANGNMTSDGYKCYVYNEANQMSKVKECGNNHTIVEYVYDYNGLRMVKKSYTTGTLSNTVVSWSDNYETKTPVGGSAQNTSYYWVNRELLAKKDNSGNRFYYQNDHLGSSSLLTNSSGNVAEQTKYDPWGEVLSGGTMSKFQYTGQEMDSETGLNYYNFRYYSSDLRRFTRPDDIIQNPYNPQDLNRYSYVRNNPIKYTDPSGHNPVLLLMAASGALNASFDYAELMVANPNASTSEQLSTVGRGFVIGATTGAFGGGVANFGTKVLAKTAPATISRFGGNVIGGGTAGFLQNTVNNIISNKPVASNAPQATALGAIGGGTGGAIANRLVPVSAGRPAIKPDFSISINNISPKRVETLQRNTISDFASNVVKSLGNALINWWNQPLVKKR